MRRSLNAGLGAVALATSFLLPTACGGGEGGDVEATIASPGGGDVLREEPFSVTGTLSRDPGEMGVWLVVGGGADDQYYPVSRVSVSRGPEGSLPWAAQFYNGVCQEAFVPGDREVMLVMPDAPLLAGIADSLALRQPMSRTQLEGGVLASVVVDIQKPDPAFCAGLSPAAPEGPAPSEGATPSEGAP